MNKTAFVKIGENDKNEHYFMGSMKLVRNEIKKILTQTKNIEKKNYSWGRNGKTFTSEIVEIVDKNDPYYEAYMVGRKEGKKAKIIKKRVVTVYE